jgi:hypothetical protein
MQLIILLDGEGTIVQGLNRVALCLVPCLALAACVAPDVRADREVSERESPVEETCHHYRLGDENIPGEIAPVLDPSNSVEACQYSNGRSGYEMYSAPERGSQGACYTTKERLFSHTRQDQTPVLEWWPQDGPSYVRAPVTFYALGVDPCPDPGDARYIPTQRVSEGAFILFWRFLERARLSRAVFASSVSAQVRGTELYEALVEKLPIEEDARDPLMVRAINFIPALTDDGLPYFEILVGSDWDHGNVLCADIAQNGDVLVTCVGEWMY